MTGSVRRYLVLGDPVAHSLSPLMHNGVIEAMGLHARYDRRRVDRDGMRNALDELRRGELAGANITMPHKRLAWELVDRSAPEADRARSVNTWVPVGDRVEGHSTDVAGVRRVVEEQGLPSDGPVVLLGTGGAAAAAMVAMAHRPIVVVARRPEAGRAMSQECAVEAQVLDWESTPPAGLVVNCTPIGMAAEQLPARMIEGATGYFEMVYAGGETPAERAIRARNLPVAGGLHLLAAQAEASFQLWFGLAPAPGLMYRLADKYLKEWLGRVES